MISGSTTRILVTLNDWISTTGVPAPLVDPDSGLVTLNIYNSTNTLIKTASMVRDGVGTFHYDWQLPAISAIGNTDVYTLEFISNLNSLPNVIRTSQTVTYN